MVQHRIMMRRFFLGGLTRIHKVFFIDKTTNSNDLHSLDNRNIPEEFIW